MSTARTIVVTGAGHGLGRAYAEALGAAGDRVVVNDVDSDAADEVAAGIRAAGGEAMAVSGSVASWNEAETLVDRAVHWHGQINGLVNNAGVLHFGAWWDETEASLRRIVDVNLLGSMFVAVHAMRAMRAHGGTILNVTSGAHLGMPQLTAYGSTKGGIASLTYGLALEGGPVGIRVNALSPLAATTIGGVTPGVDSGMPTPDQIAPVVVYLMSERADFLTGQVIRFDGRSVGLLNAARFGDAMVDDVRTVEEIQRAFDEALRDRARAPGLEFP